MTNPFENLRPGVYSRYDVTGWGDGPASPRDGALVLAGAEESSFHTLEHLDAALQLDEEATECLGLLFAGGVGKVHLAMAANFREALALLEQEEGGLDIGAVVCDCRVPEDYEALRQHLFQAGANMKERLGFCGVAQPEEALEAAKLLCCERAILCCPAATTQTGKTGSLYGACCLAAKVLEHASPARSFSGLELPWLEQVDSLPERDVQALLMAGVCVLEHLGGSVELIRGLTTARTVNGAADNRMGSLNTILIIDYVNRHVRNRLRSRLGGMGIASLGSIRDQVAVELAFLQEEGVISGFDPPRVRADAGDPTACLVDMSYQVSHLVDRIQLTAHIQV